QNLMPHEENPGYAFTRDKFFKELPEALRSASGVVARAYHRMARPPEFELYDLVEDPYEFNDLSSSKRHFATLQKLKTELSRWRTRTKDPLLNPRNLSRLKKEIDNCMENGKPSKTKLNLTYTDYFFDE
ncbi:MAG: hypothetical protein VX768_20175, partial [Planctomycetota bacterium]|nr:hypothetical protein [Planctomycetota bacterium]